MGSLVSRASYFISFIDMSINLTMNESICAMIPFYNDVDGAKRLYENLHSLGLYSVWADGRFTGFSKINNSDWSTDGTREFILSKPDTKLISVSENHQYVKMTQLLRFCEPYKYSIHIGCDEYLKGDAELFLNDLKKYDTDEPKIFRMKTIIDKNDVSQRKIVKDHHQVERIFQYPYRFEAKNTHWSFFVDGSNEPYRSMDVTIKGLISIHDNSIRPSERDQAMEDFQHMQRFEERERYYAHKQGINQKPDLTGLQTLFPGISIIENDQYFELQGKVDKSKLPLRWIRFKSPNGLCVMK